MATTLAVAAGAKKKLKSTMSTKKSTRQIQIAMERPWNTQIRIKIANTVSELAESMCVCMHQFDQPKWV